MNELKHGDRVVVTMRRRKIMYETENFWRGQIVGETRDGGAWIVARPLQVANGLSQKLLLSRAAAIVADMSSRDRACKEP